MSRNLKSKGHRWIHSNYKRNNRSLSSLRSKISKIPEWPIFIESLDSYHAQGLLYFWDMITPMLHGLCKLQCLPKLGPWKGLCRLQWMFIWAWGKPLCLIQNFHKQPIWRTNKENVSQKDIMNWGLLPGIQWIFQIRNTSAIACLHTVHSEGEDLPTSASRWKVCKVDTWKEQRAHAAPWGCNQRTGGSTISENKLAIRGMGPTAKSIKHQKTAKNPRIIPIAKVSFVPWQSMCSFLGARHERQSQVLLLAVMVSSMYLARNGYSRWPVVVGLWASIFHQIQSQTANAVLKKLLKIGQDEVTTTKTCLLWSNCLKSCSTDSFTQRPNAPKERQTLGSLLANCWLIGKPEKEHVSPQSATMMHCCLQIISWMFEGWAATGQKKGVYWELLGEPSH